LWYVRRTFRPSRATIASPTVIGSLHSLHLSVDATATPSDTVQYGVLPPPPPAMEMCSVLRAVHQHSHSYSPHPHHTPRTDTAPCPRPPTPPNNTNCRHTLLALVHVGRGGGADVDPVVLLARDARVHGGGGPCVYRCVRAGLEAAEGAEGAGGAWVGLRGREMSARRRGAVLRV
jgi:hypothetical protein